MKTFLSRIPIGWAAGTMLAATILMGFAHIRPTAARQGGGTDGATASGHGETKPTASFRENTSSAIVQPATRPARDAGFAPDELVIGVVAAGKARAYRVLAMEGRSRHLVNDMIAGVPVSIAYCDVTGCARAYTGTPGTAPLAIRVAGLLDDQMVLDAGGILFFQGSGEPVDPALLSTSHNPIAVAYAHRAGGGTPGKPPALGLPFSPLEPSVMPWKSWLALHPDTDSYAGP